MASGAPQRDQLATLLAPAVQAAGFDLEEVAVSPAGRRRVVTVVVDADGGVSLDDIADVSRAVSGVLDGNDGLLGNAPYVLEVSSPGVDRPLSEPRHWRRAAGRLVRVPVAGRTLEGRVLGADAAGVELETAENRRTFTYEELGRGRVQVEFDRPGPTGTEPTNGEENS